MLTQITGLYYYPLVNYRPTPDTTIQARSPIRLWPIAPHIQQRVLYLIGPKDLPNLLYLIAEQACGLYCMSD